MTPHQLVAVAVRLFAIWYAIFLLRELPGSFIAELQHTGEINMAKVAIAAVLVLLAFVIWFSASPIARAIVPRPATESPLPWTEKRVLTIGASLIGLWVMSYALYPIIYYGHLWFLTERNEVTGWDAQDTASLASAFATLAIGVWLFFGAHGLWRIWSRLRGRTEESSF